MPSWILWRGAHTYRGSLSAGVIGAEETSEGINKEYRDGELNENRFAHTDKTLTAYQERLV